MRDSQATVFVLLQTQIDRDRGKGKSSQTHNDDDDADVVCNDDDTDDVDVGVVCNDFCTVLLFSCLQMQMDERRTGRAFFACRRPALWYCNLGFGHSC